MTAAASTTLDSNSIGDPGRFVALADLARRLEMLAPPARDRGSVAFVMLRGEGGRRVVPDHVLLTPQFGVVGDAWGRKLDRNPEMAIAVMQAGVARLIANGQPLALFGDSLHLELDLSDAGLPAGSRVRVGSATLVVTPAPHNGCRKFQARFGSDALRLVSTKELRHRNLRGIYMRVVEGGEARLNDGVEVLSRPA
jgi:MOSC domain-containing protein YiiM